MNRNKLNNHDDENIQSLNSNDANDENIQVNHTSYLAQNKAVIASSMIVRGGLSVDNSLTVGGIIYGDVDCRQRIDSKAGFEIHGNITADSFYAVGGLVEGNLLCHDRIEVDMGSRIKGKLEADSLILNGMIEGDVIAYSSVRLGMHSNVKGNIRTASLITDKGAIFNGSVETLEKEKF